MNNFKEQFEQICKRQRILDKRILNGAEYPVDKMRIALFVELGELMNELPTYFKHWKKTAVDNKEKALEEYVDCLHFAVSLLNYYEKFDHKYYYHPEYDDCKNDSDTSLDEELEFVFKFAGSAISIESLFILGNQFGFTWNEIYNAYLKKNKINHERQDGGY